MGTLYHLRPESMVGDTLWPLSDLAAISVSAYDQAVSRYADRPGLLQQRVEPLDCRRADCVFLCPVEPDSLQQAMRRARPSWPVFDWLVIDSQLLEPRRMVLYAPRRWSPADVPPPVTASDCQPCSAGSLAAVQQATPTTLARLADPANHLPLFADVAHVLHRGPIPLREIRIVQA